MNANDMLNPYPPENPPYSPPSGQNLLADWLTRAASNYPHRIALEDNLQSWTFAELDERVTLAAKQLLGEGVNPGDRIAVLASNGLAYSVVIHALTRAGAVLVPLNTRLSESELSWQIVDSHASLLLYDECNQASAAAIALHLQGLRSGLMPDTDQHSQGTAWQEKSGKPLSSWSLRTEIDLRATQAIMYTSGTTGHPKGVLITYGMHWWNAMGSLLNIGLRSDDCWLACLPFFHIGGLSILMRSVIYGTRVLVFERFDEASINDALLNKSVSIISVVAVMLRRMLMSHGNTDGVAQYPASLRCVLLGGGPAPRQLLEECGRRSIPVVQTYGMTESCSQAATLAPEEALQKLGSAGRPLQGVQICVMKDEQEVPACEPGEIMLRGPIITPGYVGQPEATAAAFRDAGWFATGDYGYLDGEGYLYVLDRRSDLIISGGENVYPAEIEAALQEHQGVAEAGVCGVPDESWGEVPVAFVVLRSDGDAVTEAELLRFLTSRLARYKLPQRIHVAGSLPRTSSGKLIRRELPTLLC